MHTNHSFSHHHECLNGCMYAMHQSQLIDNRPSRWFFNILGYELYKYAHDPYDWFISYNIAWLGFQIIKMKLFAWSVYFTLITSFGYKYEWRVTIQNTTFPVKFCRKQHSMNNHLFHFCSFDIRFIAQRSAVSHIYLELSPNALCQSTIGVFQQGQNRLLA